MRPIKAFGHDEFDAAASMGGEKPFIDSTVSANVEKAGFDHPRVTLWIQGFAPTLLFVETIG